MNYFNKNLQIERVKVQNIVKKLSTPLYCYSYKQLKENIDNFKKSFKSFAPLICFSIKSNNNLNLIKEIKKLGLGADVVSMGELILALKAGINPKKIVFSGIGKTSNEIKFAINKKILLINAESKSEIIEIEKIAKSKKKIINIGIRLNPNIDAKTLKQITTGKKEDKFGVDEKTFLDLVNYISFSKNINLKCLSVHLGSQILDHRPYEKMLKVLDKAIKKFISSKADTLISVINFANFIWKKDKKTIRPYNYNPLNRPRSQKFNNFVMENGSFYIFRRNKYLKYKNRIHGKVTFFEMPKKSFFDIDTKEDLKIVRSL